MVVARERFFCWVGAAASSSGEGSGWVPVGGGARERLVGLPVLQVRVSGGLLGGGALVGGVVVLGGTDGGNLSGAGGVLRGVELVGVAHVGTYAVRGVWRGLG